MIVKERTKRARSNSLLRVCLISGTRDIVMVRHARVIYAMEPSMQSDSVEEMSEVGDLYWRRRVLTLEVLVAELLVKNQNMRFDLQAIEQEKSKAEASGIAPIQNRRGSALQA
jgi:hypothetical protein